MIVLGFSGLNNGELYERRYGLRFVGHDAAVALLVDGEPVFAAEEERFSRVKHTSALPVAAARAALAHAGLRWSDVDRLAYPWRVSFPKYLHMFVHHAPRVPLRYALPLAATGLRVVHDLMWPAHARRSLERALGERLPPCEGVEHHLGHSTVAYLTSPFEHAAVLTIDGQGEDESATLGEWSGTRLRRFESIRSPTSIGILYGLVTDFLGMRAGWDEYKVMAMAGEGNPERFRAEFERLVELRGPGRYRTRRTAMVFQPGYCERFLADVLGLRPRRPDEPLEPVHFDLAAALQETTRRVVFHLLRHLRELSTANALCLAGGVALNSVINGLVLESQLFERVYVPPVPGDHGGALGAALHVHQRHTRAPRRPVRFDAFLGPELTESEIDAALAAHELERHATRPADLASAAAAQLAAGAVVACCRGRMEYGPRALGHRSVLASPIDAAMRERINVRIKQRELFRPFAAIVPVERAAELFELRGESPYMQFVVAVRETWRSRLGAVQHHGRTRVQTVSRDSDPFLHELLREFERRTGVPALLNTSFNGRDEPIVHSASDALRVYLASEIDALILGSRWLVRSPSAPNSPAS
jgi:carbamoyltransferase